MLNCVLEQHTLFIAIIVLEFSVWIFEFNAVWIIVLKYFHFCDGLFGMELFRHAELATFLMADSACYIYFYMFLL